MLLVQYLTVALLATSVLEVRVSSTAYALSDAVVKAGSSGVLLAGQTLPQVCMRSRSLLVLPSKGCVKPGPPATTVIDAQTGMSYDVWCALRTQGAPLLSGDGSAVLLLGGDGNLVLYNTLAQQLYGYSFPSAIFASGTYGKGTAPYSLSMQNVRTPTLHALMPGLPATTSCMVALLVGGVCGPQTAS